MNIQRFALILSSLVILPLTLSAATIKDSSSFELSPYFWGMGMDGTVALAPLPQADMDMSFGDIWDNFETGLAGAMKLTQDKWSLYGDFSYLDISIEETLPRTTVRLDQKSYIVMLGLGYQLDLPMAGALDVIAGARYKRFETDLALSGLGARSSTEDWIDPLVGLHYAAPVTDRFGVACVANIGGFGVESELEWEVAPSVTYELSQFISASVGYRWLDTDYESDSYTYDVNLSGWIAGLTFKW